MCCIMLPRLTLLPHVKRHIFLVAVCMHKLLCIPPGGEIFYSDFTPAGGENNVPGGDLRMFLRTTLGETPREGEA